MIKIEKFEVVGWEHAIRGMRNALESWEKSDSQYHNDPVYDENYPQFIHDNPVFNIGPNDLNLMMKLRNAGPDHRKFMRYIIVYLDITAPLYWWKEFGTYRAGVYPGQEPINPMDIEMNSCSTMHKIQAKEFTRDDFSSEHIMGLCEKETPIVYHLSGNTALDPTDVLDITIMMLNKARDLYLQTKDKQYWWQMIQLLPSSYNQKRTVMLNYEVLANIYKSRKGHKLDEWNDFCRWIFTDLPYSELITGFTESISG